MSCVVNLNFIIKKTINIETFFDNVKLRYRVSANFYQFFFAILSAKTLRVQTLGLNSKIETKLDDTIYYWNRRSSICLLNFRDEKMQYVSLHATDKLWIDNGS